MESLTTFFIKNTLIHALLMVFTGVGLTITSIYFWLFCQSQKLAYRNAFLLWPFLILQYLVQIIVQDIYLLKVTFYGLFFIPQFLVMSTVFSSLKLKFSWKIYLSNLLGSYILGLVGPISDYLKISPIVKEWYLVPMSMVFCYPAFFLVKLVFIRFRKKLSPIYKIMAITLLTQALVSVALYPFSHLVHEGSIFLLRFDLFMNYVLCLVLPVFLVFLDQQEINAKISDQLHHSHKDLERKNNELEKSYYLINTFFKILIHDLGNPLMVIKHHIERSIERLSDISKTDKDRLDKILSNAMLMNVLIQKVRFFIGAKDGSLHVNKVEITGKDIQDFFEKTFAAIFDEKKRSCIIHCDESFTCRGDKDLFFMSVLGNLLTNALKYSDSDLPIKLSAVMRADGKKIVSVSGVGDQLEDKDLKLLSIKKTEQDLISYSAHDTLNSSSGLGMVILCFVVPLLGANLVVESVVLDNIQHQENQIEYNMDMSLYEKRYQNTFSIVFDQ